MNPLPDNFTPSHRLLESLLVAVVLGMTGLMWSWSVDDTLLLHLYYVPVVITGFFLGGYRARLMSLLCVATAMIIFVPYLTQTANHEMSFSMLIVFGLWSTTLILIATLVGKLSDGWHSSLAALKETHQKDLFTDALTGIANRRAYEFEVHRRLAESRRSADPLTLVLIDIDHFKSFNDRYGHPAGDTVLRSVAQSIDNLLRESDLVARYGGEEFVALLPGIGVESSQDVTERIRSTIESARFLHNGLKLRLTVSLGVAHWISGESAEALAQRADAALYSSKQVGRNCVHIHDGERCRQFSAGIAANTANSYWPNPSSKNHIEAYTDPISGLPTQKVFLEELRRRVSERTRYDIPLAVATLEFDTKIDTLGHDSHVYSSLVATMSRLASSVLRDTELIARFDDNRLAVLLPATSLNDALFPMQRLSKIAAKYHDHKYSNLSYAVSIGVVAVVPGERAGSVLQRLETATCEASNSSDHRVFVHDGSICRAAEMIAEIPETFQTLEIDS